MNIPKKSINIFCIWSNFHYILCRNIICQLGLNHADCFFVVDRGIVLGAEDKELPTMYRTIIKYGFLKRLLFYLKHKEIIDMNLADSCLSIFMPFTFYYPAHSFSEVIFFEEGFSSYGKISVHTDKFLKFKSYLKYVFVKWLKKSSSSAIRTLLFGVSLIETRPRTPICVYSLSSHAYSKISDHLLNKIVINIKELSSNIYNIPSKSIILVLDRFSEKGRPYSLLNYYKVLNLMINDSVKNGITCIWLKFHPADYDNVRLKTDLFKKLNNKKVNYIIFDGNLEYAALQNTGYTFIGTNSTILYYAPLLGNKNISVSYAKSLARFDTEYNAFLTAWGGVDSFVEIFSKTVRCI